MSSVYKIIIQKLRVAGKLRLLPAKFILGQHHCHCLLLPAVAVVGVCGGLFNLTKVGWKTRQHRNRWRSIWTSIFMR